MELEKINKKLKDKIKAMESEIKYLKMEINAYRRLHGGIPMEALF